MSAPTSRRRFLTAAGLGTVGAAGMIATGLTTGIASAQTAQDDASTVPTEADIGFCADMSTHHIQALAICQRVLGRDTGDPVQAAAAEVLQTQAIEVGTMRAWLADWGQSTQLPEMVMGWMGMNDGAGMPLAMMPGLATDAEMLELSRAEGRDAGRMWIELMRAHHVGGVNMADAAVELASAEKVVRLARVQSAVQTFEIEQYDLLLATEYA